MKNAILCVSVAIFLILTLNAHQTLAATIHVPADYATIQGAIDVAVDGDLVLVAPGTYIENIDFLGKAITVRSESVAEITFIDGNQAGSVVTITNVETEEAVLDGFTIQNGSGNFIDDSTWGGGIFIETSSPTITNCMILENSATEGGGIFILNYSNPTISSCTIAGNSAQDEGGAVKSQDSDPMITNCTIVDNFAGAGGGVCVIEFLPPTGADPTITNTIIWGNADLQIRAYSEFPVLTYSDIQRPGGVYDGEGNINADPLFVDPENGDYHITAMSPCIDAGIDAGVYTDVDGEVRPQGCGVDMGADENACRDCDGDKYTDLECGGDDCDDSREDIRPGAEEHCDGFDNDCDGLIDNRDIDEDGYIDQACGGPDCDDTNPEIYPGSDYDGDGSAGCYEDCDDADPDFYHGAPELCDGLDTDCDGIIPVDEEDGDGDGWIFCLDCDDADPQSSPGLVEGLGPDNCEDGLDNDCDGLIDYTDSGCRLYKVPTVYSTIQNAINVAFDGALIIVDPGTYVESIDFLGKAITLKSKSGFEETVISGTGGSRSVVTFADGETESTVIDGFTIRNGSGYYHDWPSPILRYGGGIYCESSSPSISNCMITENHIASDCGEWEAAFARGGGIYCTGSSPTITKCIISDNSVACDGDVLCCSANTGAGIYCEGPDSLVTIRDCIISNNICGMFNMPSGGGISSNGASLVIENCIISENDGRFDGGGIHCINSPLLEITNSTIAWNLAGLHGSGIHFLNTPTEITNSIIWGNYVSQQIYGAEELSDITYSDVEGGWPGEGNIDVYPLFGSADYRLTVFSPCIDAGDPEPAYYDECFPPSMGTELNDMGAYGGPGACEWCDADHDGYDNEFCGGYDCDDFDPATYPGAPEICDEKDNNCDGVIPDDELTDEDSDGWVLCDDCDETDPLVNPAVIEGAAAENCNDGVDNDCDGLIDTDQECIPIQVPIGQPTIQAAIEAAGLGDLIIVSPGTYSENINFMGKYIKVKSTTGPYKTTIFGNQRGSVVTFRGGETSNTVLDGFSIQNGSGTQGSFPPWSSTYFGGGIYCYKSSPMITKCIISDNFAQSGGGIYCYQSTSTFTNCMITGNMCYDSSRGGGGFCINYSSPTITNCTIAQNVSLSAIGGTGGGVFQDHSSTIITNSIIWNNHSYFGSQIYDEHHTAIITYTDVEGGWTGEGNIDADPHFVGGVTYHLRPGSPCVDTGTDAGVYTDMEGQTRPWGAGFDMGADEFSTEPCSVIASSGNQFLAFYLIQALALVFFRRRFLRR